MDPAQAFRLEVSSRYKVVNKLILKGESDIQKFYDNSTIFVTGATGFLGKQLIEKLLRSCKRSKIYVLLRAKKGKSVLQRLETLLEDLVFEELRFQQPDFKNKLEVVNGDVSQLRLGMNVNDWNFIASKVNIIFNLAATTRFDETLKVATLINVRGTRELLVLAKACKKLRSFVHVSTAFSHATTKRAGKEVLEQFYPCPIPPDVMISLAEDMDEHRLNKITKNSIKDWPNTYTIAKAMAEEVVKTKSNGLPICIVRPAIVIASQQEPSPGWLDMNCVYGASGLIAGIWMGILHVMHVRKNLVTVQLVPCDLTNNAIIAAGKETAISQSKGGSETKIYNVTTSTQNPFLYDNLCKLLRENMSKTCTPLSLYYACSLEISNAYLYKILFFFMHMIPAYIVDFVCVMFGKPRSFVKLYEKVSKISDALSYFLMNEWKFDNKNLEKLFENLSPNDKLIFNFNLNSLNWSEFLTLWCYGIRQYILKDGLKDTEYAWKKQSFLCILHYILTAIYLYVLWKILNLFIYILLWILF